MTKYYKQVQMISIKVIIKIPSRVTSVNDVYKNNFNFHREFQDPFVIM